MRVFVRPARGPIAAPYPARHHRRADGLLGPPVRGLESRTVQEGEDRIALVLQMFGEPRIGCRAVGTVQCPVQPRLQPSASDRQTVLGDRAFIAPPKSTAVLGVLVSWW